MLLFDLGSIWDGYMGQYKTAKERIELKPLTEGRINLRCTWPAKIAREFERIKIEKLLSEEHIKPVQTVWAPSFAFALKKNSSFPFCVDYQNLKAATTRNVSLILRMDDCIDSFAETSVITVLDANSQNLQVEIENGDRDKTSFMSHHELYCLVRMHFRLRNALRTLQQTMDVVLPWLDGTFP